MKNNFYLNQYATARNPFQGEYKKVLCCCSAGVLRSPTAALVLSQDPYRFNTRAVGCVAEHALIPVNSLLLEWADEIVCMELGQVKSIERMLKQLGLAKPVINLDIPDRFPYRDETLIEMIKTQYDKKTSV